MQEPTPEERIAELEERVRDLEANQQEAAALFLDMQRLLALSQLHFYTYVGSQELRGKTNASGRECRSRLAQFATSTQSEILASMTPMDIVRNRWLAFVAYCSTHGIEIHA